MSENITQRAEAAKKSVWRVHVLELGAFKQGIFLWEDGVDAGSQLPALSLWARCTYGSTDYKAAATIYSQEY